MASRIVTITKERTKLAAAWSCSASTLAGHARFVRALDMQPLETIPAMAWMVSAAMDISAHMSTFYLDVGIFLQFGDIWNFHLLAIPMFERHIGGAMFKAASETLRVLCADWRDSLGGVSTD